MTADQSRATTASQTREASSAFEPEASSVSVPSAASSHPALSATSNAVPSPTAVDHEQVAALPRELGPAVVQSVAGVVAGLRREPDDDLPLLPGPDQLDEDVRVLGERERRRIGAVFLDLVLGE